MIRCFVLLLYASESLTFGYDSGGGDQAACGRPYRSGRVYQPPCDLGRQGYCTSAGARYPWHAVKRFVRDNQGLMRRMYGDQRHGHVLRVELDEEMDLYDPLYDWHPPSTRSRFSRYQRHEKDDIDNELVPNEDNDDEEDDEAFIEEARYLRDDISNADLLNTKFVYSEQPAKPFKLVGLKTAPHFRPTTTTRRTTTLKPKITTLKTGETTTFKQILKTTILKPLKTTTTTANKEQKTTSTPSTTQSATTATSPPLSTSKPISPTGPPTTTTATTITSTPVTFPTTTTVFSSTTTTLNLEDSTTETTTEETTTMKKQMTTTTPTTKPTSTSPHTVSIADNKQPFSPSTAWEATGDKQPTTSLPLNVASDRLGEEENSDDKNSDGDKTSDSTDDNSATSDGINIVEKIETMLFQDMAEEVDESKKKMHVNYKLRGVNACPVKEEVVAPFWANNTRGEVLALLNMYPFEQYVHWEKCTFEHRQMYCREGCRCEQQYRLHRMLAYDPNNECRGIFSDWFRFPSCCVCKCYDVPAEFRVTSRSPRFQQNFPET